ncbi:MAG: DUF2950 domain-containing protein [Gammaproteobacteria bacterium]
MSLELLKALRTALLSGIAAISIQTFAKEPAIAEPLLQFASPQEAANFLIEALSADDLEQLEALVSPGYAEILYSGNDMADSDNRKAFAAAANKHLRLEQSSDGVTVMLYVGEQEWLFPLPLKKNGKSWIFDAVKGKEELLNRRIGRNELAVLRVMRGYVDAQFEYAGQDRDGDGIAEYAQKLVSDTGTQDGLYWPVPSGSAPSPIGPLLAHAQLDLSSIAAKNASPPYHGYYYKILYRQGHKAPGGNYMYVVNGNMISGFGLLAFPAHYGESGVYTFTVNHRGEIYQRDLGSATTKIAVAIKEYDPDEKWERVKAEE